MTSLARTLALPGLLITALALGACTQGSATNPNPPAAQESSPASGSADPSESAGATEPAAEQVSVHYMNFSANGGHEADLQAIADAFTAENPDIALTLETVPYADYFTKLQTAVAAGTAGDAFELNYENFVTYREAGALAPLDGVDASLYKPSLLEAFQHEGSQYGLPESFSNVVLFYNADLFEAAGVEPPTSEWTWADEKAAAEKLTDKEAGVWGDYQPVSFHEFYKALAQAGGTFLSEDGTQATFNSPEGIKAAQWLTEKMGTTMPTAADGVGTPDYDSNLFKTGKLAMWHTGIWMFDGMADAPFSWDIAVEPGDTTNASAMFTNAAVVNANSANAEAAQKWITFLTSSEAMVQQRLDTAWELPPVADEALLSDYLTKGKPANRQAVLDSLDKTVLPPVIEAQQEMQDIVGEELSAAADGSKTVEAALTDAESRVNALLG
ncbi:sugar ABC transporter substrate-binding protein [Tessaracoccus lubricantis]|uniref:Sugar ABC transporter substrate-binding protein n=1 Tax=Tessaracoccus lubricantis TaxID=545543 RepID=A0ABP9EY48_9ACTN